MITVVNEDNRANLPKIPWLSHCDDLARKTEGVVLRGSSGRPPEVFKIKITGFDRNNPDQQPYLRCAGTAWTSDMQVDDFTMTYERDGDGDWWFRIWAPVDPTVNVLYPQQFT